MPQLWDPYKSVYKKDYVKKPIKRVPAFARPQEFEDPVAEGFKHYLVLDEKDVKEPKENGEEYLEKFKEKYKKAGRLYFPEPLHKEEIFMQNIVDSVTEYQTKYCDILKDLEYYREQKSKKFELPPDYEVSLTTHNSHFKHPLSLNSKAYKQTEVVIPPTSLGTNEKINEILNVKTGHTEYQDDIGKLGELIVSTHLYGNTVKLPALSLQNSK